MEKKSMWLAPKTMRTVAIAAAATAALAAGSVAGAYAADMHWDSTFYDNGVGVKVTTTSGLTSKDDTASIIKKIQGTATKPVELSTGWYKVDKDWYYYQAGVPGKDPGFVTGDFALGDQHYYFNAAAGKDAGKLYTNKWILSQGTDDSAAGNYYVNENGYAVHGWNKIGSEWFRFGDDANKTNTDGVVDPDGQLIQGWSEYNGDWYYFNPMTQEKSDAHAEMLAGQQVKGTDYVLAEDGTLANGWVKKDGKWNYYAAGIQVKDAWKMVDGSWYHFDAEGVMQTGFVTLDEGKATEKTYFFADWGGLQIGWFYNGEDVKSADTVKYAKGWYHSDKDGAIDSVKGWKSIDGKWYFFMKDGHMFDKNVAYGTDEQGKTYEFSFDASGAWTGTKDLGVMPADINTDKVLENIA